jgi:hypothetical protein
MRTIHRAEQIKQDPGLMKEVKKMADEHHKAVTKIRSGRG